jgi:hypothetical protein
LPVVLPVLLAHVSGESRKVVEWDLPVILPKIFIVKTNKTVDTVDQKAYYIYISTGQRPTFKKEI